MAIPGLTIIGETINDSVPSTKQLFDTGDVDGLLDLARRQDAGGAAFIDVNVGPREPAFMADVVRRIQQVTTRPLAIDSPDPTVARAGLEAYDPDRCAGQKPILNSISPLRLSMLELYGARPFRPIFLVSEQVQDGQTRPCRTAGETYEAARMLLAAARQAPYRIPNDDVIFDPGIAPLASDFEGNLKRLLETMRLIRDDPDMAGVHMSVGLSNFTVMLPSRRTDGSPVKGPLESAILTRAMPLGLDMIIGSVKRRYELLAEDHPAMLCLDRVLSADGFEALVHVRDFYV
jgi:5-methyltetrahydrofolate corrinoid/iron sulfur protein methyltransferase